MQAITTRVLPPTNTRGARIVVECDRARMVVPYPYGNQEQAHRAACQAMLDSFAAQDVAGYGRGTTAEDHHWGPFVSGQTKGGDWVHVLIGRGSVVVQRAEVEALRKWREERKEGRGCGGIELVRLAKVIDAALGN